MDINGKTPLSPLESAKAVLGEHYKNYVIIVQNYDTPTTYDVAFSDPYAAHGLLDCSNTYHKNYLNAGMDNTEYTWVWEEEEEEED